MGRTKGKPRGKPFQPGNPGGPGRPSRETEREYLDSMIGAVPLADWRAIVRRAVADAKKGDGAARVWLSRHLLPKDGLDPISAAIEYLKGQA